MDDEVRLNIKITAELMARVKAAAKAKQLTVSSLTRLLLVNYLERVENEQQNSKSKN